MKESYGEGLANHTGPESCGGAGNCVLEALTGVRAGRPLSREKEVVWGADAVGVSGRRRPLDRKREIGWSPTRSETPRMHGNTSHGNREILCSPVVDGTTGRAEKSKDVRRR